MKLRKPKNSGSNETGTNQMQRGGRARLSPEVQRRIGQQLRSMYDDVVKQGVPGRFAQLLKQLDEPGDKDKQG